MWTCRGISKSFLVVAPCRSFPSPVAAMVGSATLGFSRELRTRPIRNRPRTSRWGQVEHRPVATSSTYVEPPQRAHSSRATSRRNNDNPYSEAQFKTLKYRPAFPDRFDSIEHARQLCGEFFGWYNHDHRHSGIGLHTPASVHFGTAEEIRRQRGIVLAQAYTAHPERFVHRAPQSPKLPDTVWINPPTDDTGKEETEQPPGHSTK